MSDLLGLGAAGLKGYSRALQTIGDNIANAQTPGYARRSTIFAEQVPGGDSVFYRNQIAPGGVLVTGVVRATDPWLIEDARTSSADAGRSGARLGWLQSTEAVLADGGQGVGNAITGLFNRADELAADPGNLARRNAFLQSVDGVATSFRRTADGLAHVADGISQSATQTVVQLNADLEGLVRVNEGLRRARDGSSNQATLLDERDKLLDSISTALPATVSFDAKGAASLVLPGGTLLAGSDRTTLGVAVGADGRLSVAATNAAGGFAVASASGSLSGLVDAADHVASQRSALDTMARDFAALLNAQHGAGRDANGNAGVALLTGTGAASIAAVALSPADVAAADASGANGNALAFGNLRGGGGSEDQWAALTAQQSQVVANARAQDLVLSSRASGSLTARDAVSGIDLDNQAAELMRFQQAYQASARVIQVARETMQTILNSL